MYLKYLFNVSIKNITSFTKYIFWFHRSFLSFYYIKCINSKENCYVFHQYVQKALQYIFFYSSVKCFCRKLCFRVLLARDSASRKDILVFHTYSNLDNVKGSMQRTKWCMPCILMGACDLSGNTQITIAHLKDMSSF